MFIQIEATGIIKHSDNTQSYLSGCNNSPAP